MCPMPTTTGRLCSTISEMKIGDYILMTFDSVNLYHITNDVSGKAELEINGNNGTNLSSFYWYGIKVDKGLIISDRVVLHSKSWDYFNSYKRVQGELSVSQDGTNTVGAIRMPSGGVAYADEHENKSLADTGNGGWPCSNEWDKYIVNFPSELIQSGKTLDDIFHWSNVRSFCQETPINSVDRDGDGTVLGTNVRRVSRGMSAVNTLFFHDSNISGTGVGFRPVFEYQE